MIILPGRNFARYLLTCFILFCLVLRTAYQGKQFEFLQKDMRPADVATIDEMIDKNFTFYVVDQKYRFMQDVDFINR